MFQKEGSIFQKRVWELGAGGNMLVRFNTNPKVKGRLKFYRLTIFQFFPVLRSGITKWKEHDIQRMGFRTESQHLLALCT